MTLRVGLIGCGKISDIYLKTLSNSNAVEITACASLALDESQAKAAQYGVPVATTPKALLADPDIDAVLNLTVPASHAEISLAALGVGKHVYAEKPFATTLEDGERILALAAEKGLKVGNAPDTFLGGRWQTVRRLIDEGAIGAPTGVAAFVGTHGVERHHPNPDFYYAAGGGPLLDLGPYYLTAMVFLLGPIARVAGMGRRTFDRRMIENGPRNGEWMPVEVDTHVNTMIEFRSGVIGAMTISFDVWDSEMARFEIYGEEGTICIPDPDPVHGANIFQGEVWVKTRDTSRWSHQPRPEGREEWAVADNRHGLNEDSRGAGLIDLADAIREGRAPRCDGAMAHHVLEAMLGALESAGAGAFHQMQTTCDRPATLPETRS